MCDLAQYSAAISDPHPHPSHVGDIEDGAEVAAGLELCAVEVRRESSANSVDTVRVQERTGCFRVSVLTVPGAIQECAQVYQVATY